MMYVDPPFELHETLKGKDDDGNFINGEVLGKKYFFPAQRLSGDLRGNKSRRTGKGICAIALRNQTGLTLYGGYLVKMAVTAPSDFATSGYNMQLLETVTGYATDLAEKNVVAVSSYLPATGVPDDHIFWGIVSGLVTLKTRQDANIAGAIAIGSKLVAATGTTSGSTNSGRVDFATETTAAHAFNWVARALSAATTAQTDTSVLVDMAIQW